jgi:hypothetical protein
MDGPAAACKTSSAVELLTGPIPRRELRRIRPGRAIRDIPAGAAPAIIHGCVMVQNLNIHTQLTASGKSSYWTRGRVLLLY